MKRLFLFSLITALSSYANAYDFKQNGICYNILSVKDKTVEVAGNPDNYTGAVKIEETVDFDGSTYTVIGIAKGAFHNCQGLTSVVLPETTSTIGESAFSLSPDLTNIEIPKSVTYIGQFAFHHCDNLKSAIIPSGVTYLYPCTFDNCTSLESIGLPANITNIGIECFQVCENLREITLPDSLVILDDNALWGCKNLKNIIIPANVALIGEFCFGSCEKLESLEIRSYTTIRKNAFNNCNALKAIKLTIASPAPIPDNAFPGIVKLNATLYVPQGSKANIENLDGWGDFANIVETDVSSIRATRSDATGGKAYRLDGTPANDSTKGLIIKDGTKMLQR